MQSHYVVVYDHETGKFQLDSDTEQARFPEGNIWDEDSESWTLPESAGEILRKDTAGYGLLHHILSNFNEKME